MKSLSSSDLLQELKSRPVRSPEVSRALGKCKEGGVCVCVGGGIASPID